MFDMRLGYGVMMSLVFTLATTDVVWAQSKALLRSGEIVLRGNIVDENGGRVTEASLVITPTVVVDGGFRSGMKERRRLNGEFNVTLSNVNAVRALFFAEGREPVLIERTIDGEAKERAKGEKEASPDLRIVLEKSAREAKLREFTGQLIRHSDGTGVALDLEQPSNKATTKVDSDGWSKLGRAVVYLDAKRDKAGLFEVSQVYAGRMPQRPSMARLCISGEQSGFVEYPLGENRHFAWRRLRQAPEAGYLRELAFEYTSVPTWELETSSGAFFYVRDGQLYGKGNVSEISVSLDRKSIAARIEIRIQPDQSRNVVTHDSFDYE